VAHNIIPFQSVVKNGTELVVVYKSESHISSGKAGQFWTDSNGLDLMERQFGHSGDPHEEVDYSLAGNHYPVNRIV
jgi:hypothetical protein